MWDYSERHSVESFSTEDITPEWLFPCPYCGKRRHQYKLLDAIHRRWTRNENTNIIIIGANRSGKSHTSMRFGQDTDRRFDATHNLWSLPSLLKAYSTHKLSYFNFEEIGQNLDRLLWYSEFNRIFRHLMETQAYLLNVLGLNAPDIMYFPKTILPLCHFLVETHRFGKVVQAKFYQIRVDRLRGKIKFMVIGNIEVHSPNEELIDEYQDQKEDWNKKNLQQWLEDVTQTKGVGKQEDTMNINNRFGYNKLDYNYIKKGIKFDPKAI